MRKLVLVVTLCGSLSIGPLAFAQAGSVATVCAADIQKFCTNKGHGAGQTRSCLEANRKNLSAECQEALSSTRGGKR